MNRQNRSDSISLRHTRCISCIIIAVTQGFYSNTLTTRPGSLIIIYITFRSNKNDLIINFESVSDKKKLDLVGGTFEGRKKIPSISQYILVLHILNRHLFKKKKNILLCMMDDGTIYNMCRCNTINRSYNYRHSS